MNLSSTPVSVAQFRDGMSLLPGAVTVITTGGPAGLAGFTASAVCSVTDSPPTLLVCMNRSSYAHEFFKTNAALCVNVLGADQRHVSQLFASRDVTMPQRFERCGWRILATGSPALDGAVVNLDGVITATHEVGTHSVFIVALHEIARAQQPSGVSGLAYFNRGYHALPAQAQDAAVL